MLAYNCEWINLRNVLVFQDYTWETMNHTCSVTLGRPDINIIIIGYMHAWYTQNPSFPRIVIMINQLSRKFNFTQHISGQVTGNSINIINYTQNCNELHWQSAWMILRQKSFWRCRKIKISVRLINLIQFKLPSPFASLFLTFSLYFCFFLIWIEP